MLENLTCTPGSYVEIVPIGLLCTLQYNSNGILQKIIKGFNPVNHTDADVFESDLTIQLKSEKLVPQRIPFTQGTTWVKGAFYTVRQFKSEGILPDCIQEDLYDDLKIHMQEYTFYAGDLHNDSFNFAGGGGVIATRLSTFGFTVLPGYQVFDDVGVFPIEQIMRTKKSPFVYPLVSGIFVHQSINAGQYLSANLVQRVVYKVSTHLESHGYILANVDFKTDSIDVPYRDVVNYNVGEKSTVVLNGSSIVYSKRYGTLFNEKASREIRCLICGKKISVPHFGHTHCSDEHCLSRMYPAMRHFLSTLKLPELDFYEFLQLIQNKKVTCLIDILDVDPYNELKVDTTLSNLLFAATPIEICPNADFFQKFTNYLGSVEALDYYLNNPDTIVSDLKLPVIHAKKYADWLKDPENCLMIRSLLDAKDQISIQSVLRKFEGAPIFRGKTICLTGIFQHGTLEDVISILQSYSAKVVTAFDTSVHCVIVGHFENEDKSIVDLATSYNIPIYGEDDFFRDYEIDVDLRKQRDMFAAYLV